MVAATIILLLVGGFCKEKESCAAVAFGLAIFFSLVSLCAALSLSGCFVGCFGGSKRSPGSIRTPSET
jgi:hypothetical protein